ncbi:MAG: TadE/TadG family type IV pilus assembly protein [Terracidiphilus sp.]|nr:TadE/TadG family type IV pilus assembly protein [Terracidiphilus sp.]MDR3798743.1 TadE/TadG family type IV pilus assembly protein [Terracidiphilus sp.]
MKTDCGLRKPANSLAHRLRRLFHLGADDGNALVEMALVLPVFLAFVTGIGSFAIALGNQITLIQATGSGGQYLQQLRNSTTDPCKDTITAIENAAPNLAPGSIGLTLTLNGNSPITGASCSGKQTQLIEGATVTVATTYPCTLSVYGVKFANSCNLSAQVTEYEY